MRTSRIVKRPAEVWKALCNIHKTKSSSNIIFVCHKFFACKIQADDDLFDHVNNLKVKVLVDQLAYLKVYVRKEDIVIFFESLPTSYEHLIIALEKMLVKDLTKEYVTTHLIHDV